ncbi:hypothetical protein TIFTF001_022136 [Ficus carica]|uniref:Uncharacterized protein n=1 Tax=Ficus carica TaxID=3494 RepID=A0AA88AVH1_FICCA|nr:hypothetical protein TIFTF001_022136 [Ficus carica]
MASFSTPPVFVSQEEFMGFHAIDRELYAALVISLFRDPAEAMQIMALWLWLESEGFHNLVKKMLSLPQFLINELADEAVVCLSFITAPETPLSHETNGEIPLIQSLMEKEISFQYFRDNRLRAGQEIAKIMKEVCVRALSDIMQQANQVQDLGMPADAATSFHHSPGLGLNLGPGPGPYPVQIQQPWNGASTSTNAGNSKPDNGVHPDDRTMFVTFSKGYPVFEWEVREFFTMTYGNCIESLHMQDVQPNEQSLFARIVFHTASTIDRILNGVTTAKFTINGKHVWMRKYVPRRSKSKAQQAPQQLPNLPDSLFD